MSIRIFTADGRKVYDDDLAVQLSIAKAEGGEVPLSAIIDHLELIGQVPEAYGTSTAFAARAALTILRQLPPEIVDLDEAAVPAGS